MKYTFVILLFTALVAQTFSRSIAMADYLVNLEAYKKACINKAKPKTHCNGKCQMMKKLKKQEGNKQANMPTPIFNQNELVLSSKSFFPSLYIVNVKYTSAFYNYTDDFLSSYSGSIFHPPSNINC